MKRNAQSILEYAIILSVIILAFSAMSLYFRRGIQSVIRVAADEAGNQQEAEDIDPLKGTKEASAINKRSQMNQRTRALMGNERINEFNILSEVTGNSVSVSTQEK
jgi:hypothetical protein